MTDYQTEQHEATHDHHPSGHDEEHGVGHVVSPKILIANGLALLVLTALTVGIAKFDFGEANVWVALSIAGLKVSLVCLFFMHLFWDRPFNSFIFVTSIAFVVVFIGFALSDTFAYREDIVRYEQDVATKANADVTPRAESSGVKQALKDYQKQQAERAAEAAAGGAGAEH